jgi:1D-myo-inositol-tetrakisphosphate 5-kinase/inositol-polyphosphate multikinase
VHDNASGLAVYTPKSYGKSLKANQLSEGIARFFPVGDATSNGLPKETLHPTLQGIREEVQEIRNIFAELEVRMVGGSLLVIYEADWEKAEEKLNQEEDDEDDDDDDDDDAKSGPPFAVKVIDFAHTTLMPGQGVDSGVLVGLDTVLRLLDGRLSEIN